MNYDYVFYEILACVFCIEYFLIFKGNVSKASVLQSISHISCAGLVIFSNYFTGEMFSPVLLWLMHHILFDASGLSSTLQFIVALILLDFSVYWLHRWQHAIPVLWATHATHHQPTEMNILVGVRQSFLGFWYNWLGVILLLLIQFDRDVLLLVLFVARVYGVLVHVNYQGRFPYIDKLFVTPRIHRVHHGWAEPYRNKNYSDMLIIWDKLFGTYQEPLANEIELGIGKNVPAIINPVWASLLPYWELVAKKNR